MNEQKFISRFSPNRTDPDDLERITVQRGDLIRESVDLIRESALTRNKHHLFFVGPRGCGKTHLLTLIVHRLQRQPDLAQRLRIAWLNEDETSTSFLDLLLRIYRALSERYPKEFPSSELEALYGQDPDQARDTLGETLIKHIGKRTVLVLVENVDSLLKHLDDIEQRTWRAFIQNHPVFTTAATAQSLVDAVSNRDEPFFGFFDIRHLKPLSVEEATELLQRIAQLNAREDLSSFLATPHGRARVRAIHHLSGGNHRLYIVLSDFITRESLEELVGPFEVMVDEQLTPYFQERLRWLSPQQRKIVEFLCQRHGPVPVKDIAERLFVTHSTVTGQLMKLRELCYVRQNPRGRESLYELEEPLMRLSMQVKETHDCQPLRLLVDMLRVWYEPHELEDRLAHVKEETRERTYYATALKLQSEEPNFLHELLRQGFESVDLAQCDKVDLLSFRMLAERTGNQYYWWKYGIACHSRGDFEETVEAFTRIIELPGVPTKGIAEAIFNRGVTFAQMGKFESAFADYTRVIELPNSPIEQIANALINRGSAFTRMGKFEDAIKDYSRIIELRDAHTKQITIALNNRALAFKKMGKIQDAIIDYTHAIELPGAPVEQIAKALNSRIVAFGQIGKDEDAFVDYTRLLNIPNAPLELIAEAKGRMAKIFFESDRWNQGMNELNSLLSEQSNSIHGITRCGNAVIEAIFRQIGSPKIWQERVAEVAALYAKHHALAYLGEALVRHLRTLGKKLLSDEGLDGWLAGWKSASEDVPGMQLPLRLLGVGIDYLKTKPRDEGVLLALHLEERSILRQALSLPPEKDL